MVNFELMTPSKNPKPANKQNQAMFSIDALSQRLNSAHNLPLDSRGLNTSTLESHNDATPFSGLASALACFMGPGLEQLELGSSSSSSCSSSSSDGASPSLLSPGRLSGSSNTTEALRKFGARYNTETPAIDLNAGSNGPRMLRLAELDRRCEAEQKLPQRWQQHPSPTPKLSVPLNTSVTTSCVDAQQASAPSLTKGDVQRVLRSNMCAPSRPTKPTGMLLSALVSSRTGKFYWYNPDTQEISPSADRLAADLDASASAVPSSSDDDAVYLFFHSSVSQAILAHEHSV